MGVHSGGSSPLLAPRPVPGPIQPPIQWVPGADSPELKQPGCEADHQSPSSAEVKNTWSYTSIPPIRLLDVVLNKYWNICIFTPILLSIIVLLYVFISRFLLTTEQFVMNGVLRRVVRKRTNDTGVGSQTALFKNEEVHPCNKPQYHLLNVMHTILFHKLWCIICKCEMFIAGNYNVLLHSMTHKAVNY
jgi:hypothetical protein